MAAVHPSAFANSFNIRERARLSRVVAESVERQSSRIEARFDRFRVDMRESRRQSPIASLEAKPRDS
jgi:hypothetical protein